MLTAVLLGMQKWTAVFESFVDADGNGVTVAKKGSPETFIGELEDAVEDETCEVSDITKFGVYTFLFPARRL